MHSVYIHIPFCKTICTYCDFCKVFYNEKFATKYLQNLEKEILSQYNNEILDTIYIGGGTPSSLNPSPQFVFGDDDTAILRCDAPIKISVQHAIMVHKVPSIRVFFLIIKNILSPPIKV